MAVRYGDASAAVAATDPDLVDEVAMAWSDVAGDGVMAGSFGTETEVVMPDGAEGAADAYVALCEALAGMNDERHRALAREFSPADARLVAAVRDGDDADAVAGMIDRLLVAARMVAPREPAVASTLERNERSLIRYACALGSRSRDWRRRVRRLHPPGRVVDWTGPEVSPRVWCEVMEFVLPDGHGNFRPADGRLLAGMFPDVVFTLAREGSVALYASGFRGRDELNSFMRTARGVADEVGITDGKVRVWWS